MVKEYQDIIESICVRFNNVISPFDVLAWLENFDAEDRKKALIVLNHFEFFSTNDIVKEFNLGLSKIANEQYPDKNIYILPLGKIGKSGAAMAYYIKKTPVASNNKKIKIIQNSDIPNITEDSVVVVVDDFAGTGGSIVDFYNSIKLSLPNPVNVCALTVAYMEKAEANLKKSNILVFGNKRCAAFIKRGSVFGYFPQMTIIRDFCFTYGSKLYPEQKYKDKKTKLHPLGYINSQSLIGFDHSIPNNTLPIIWADSKVEGSDQKWIPLFPRRGSLLIERSKQFRESQYYWISLMFKLGLNRGLFDWEEKYDKDTMQLVSIIFLKKRHRSPLSICQKLGLNIDSYNAIIEQGQAKNLFDADEKLTDLAISIFDEIQKKSRFQKNNISEALMITEEIIYVPKKFRGNS